MASIQQFIPKILVTTDFDEDSEQAFFHALAIAVASQARFTLLHTGSESRDEVAWERFPGVRETLTRWGLLPADAPRSAVQEILGLAVSKMAMRDDDPRQGIADYLRKHPTDMIVMATRGRTGMARMRSSSVAESVVTKSRSHALLLPREGRGFVDRETGNVSIRRVLCALDGRHDPRPGLAYLARWIPALGGEQAEILALNSGTAALLLPTGDGRRWEQRRIHGYSADAIIEAAGDFEPDLLVTSTQGSLGLKARMRGSLIDRLLKELRLPLLSIPER